MAFSSPGPRPEGRAPIPTTSASPYARKTTRCPAARSKAGFPAAGDKVVVDTRRWLDWTDKFGPLAAHIAALDLPPCLIDGENIARNSAGNADFFSLQAVLKRSHGSQTARDALEFHIFDLFEVDERGRGLRIPECAVDSLSDCGDPIGGDGLGKFDRQKHQETRQRRRLCPGRFAGAMIFCQAM